MAYYRMNFNFTKRRMLKFYLILCHDLFLVHTVHWNTFMPFFVRLRNCLVYTKQTPGRTYLTLVKTLAAFSHISHSGTRWRSWLRHCATSRKVGGSIPDGVTGIVHWHNPSGRTMFLGLTQPLTEMNTRNNSWGVRVAGAKGWQTYHLHVPIVLKSGSLNHLETYGPVQACNGIVVPCFTLPSLPYKAMLRVQTLQDWAPLFQHAVDQ
jgi:hypothetical protein